MCVNCFWAFIHVHGCVCATHDPVSNTAIYWLLSFYGGLTCRATLTLQSSFLISLFAYSLCVRKTVIITSSQKMLEDGDGLVAIRLIPMDPVIAMVRQAAQNQRVMSRDSISSLGFSEDDISLCSRFI